MRTAGASSQALEVTLDVGENEFGPHLRSKHAGHVVVEEGTVGIDPRLSVEVGQKISILEDAVNAEVEKLSEALGIVLHVVEDALAAQIVSGDHRPLYREAKAD